MEQEQILSELKTKIGISGESAFDRSITTYIGKNLPENGTEPDANYLNKHSEILKSFYGQYNHDVAETVTKQANSKFEEFKKSYKPDAAKTEPTKVEEEIPSWAKELKEKLEAREALENGKAKLSLKEQKIANAYVSAKTSGAENEAVLDIVKSLISVDDDDTELSVKDKIVSLYNTTYKKLYGNGAYPTSNSGGSTNKKAEKDDYLKHLEATGKLPKKN